MLTITPEPQTGLFTVSFSYFTAIVSAVPSASPDWGLLGGRIIKLAIREEETGEMVFNYDRGFDFDNLDKAGRRFLAAVVEHFDGVRFGAYPLTHKFVFITGFAGGLLSAMFVQVVNGIAGWFRQLADGLKGEKDA